MAKIPYIPLYIGDWEQDTNLLSPLAEFALLKLTFKLFCAEKRGVFITNFKTLSVLFKSNIDETKIIFNELYDNKILNFEFLDGDKIQIISRRMVREAHISEIRSMSGGLGGRGNKSKPKAKQKQTESKRKAKSEQNAEYDNEYNIKTIINYLNEKTEKKFQETTRATVANIQARTKEGYSLENFLSVIDTKTDQWLTDEKMVKYLNPETLFGNKFEKYLNETPKIKLPVNSAVKMTDEEYEKWVAGDYNPSKNGL